MQPATHPNQPLNLLPPQRVSPLGVASLLYQPPWWSRSGKAALSTLGTCSPNMRFRHLWIRTTKRKRRRGSRTRLRRFRSGSWETLPGPAPLWPPTPNGDSPPAVPGGNRSPGAWQPNSRVAALRQAIQADGRCSTDLSTVGRTKLSIFAVGKAKRPQPPSTMGGLPAMEQGSVLPVLHMQVKPFLLLLWQAALGSGLSYHTCTIPPP